MNTCIILVCNSIQDIIFTFGFVVTIHTVGAWIFNAVSKKAHAALDTLHAFWLYMRS